MADVREEYGRALYALAKEENSAEEILADVKGLAEICRENPEYVRLISAPDIKKEERISLIDEAFGGRVNDYTLNFMKILIERNYFRYLDECCEEFIKIYNEDNGIETVTVYTSVHLDALQKEKLMGNLSKKLSKKIELTEKIDSSLIGGIRIETSGELIDGSVKARIDSVRELLDSTVL